MTVYFYVFLVQVSGFKIYETSIMYAQTGTMLPSFNILTFSMLAWMPIGLSHS